MKSAPNRPPQLHLRNCGQRSHRKCCTTAVSFIQQLYWQKQHTAVMVHVISATTVTKCNRNVGVNKEGQLMLANYTVLRPDETHCSFGAMHHCSRDAQKAYQQLLSVYLYIRVIQLKKLHYHV
jgi:hypothetical protein